MLLLAFDARANPIFVVAGKVADSTGAAMVNAKVQVSNQTNTSLETKETTTNAEGLYKILFMDMFDDGDLNNSFISLGDVLKIHVLNASNEVIAEHSWVVMPLQIINKIIESNIQLFSLVEDIPQTINFSPVDSTKRWPNIKFCLHRIGDSSPPSTQLQAKCYIVRKATTVGQIQSFLRSIMREVAVAIK